MYLANDEVADAINFLYATQKITVSSAAAPFPRRTGEDASQRISQSATYVDPAGHHTVRVYAGPVYYRDANGAWQPIDNTLVADGSGGVSNAANSFRASLPSDISAPVRYDTAQGWVSFQLAGARGRGNASGSHDTYGGALPGVDIAYSVGNAGVKETLTLANRSAPSTYSYALSTSAGLTPRINRSGGVDFVNGVGVVAFAFAPPSMVDAVGASSDRVRFKLSHAGTELTLAADKQWLSSSSRASPVVVDPSFVANGADRECFIRDGVDAATSFCGGSSIDVGSDGTQTSRGLPVWDLSWLPANTIVQSATLGLYVQDEANGTPVAIDVHHVTSPWTVSTTWNEADTGVPWTAPGGDFAATDATATVGGSAGVTATWNVTGLAQHWIDGSVANDGLILAAPAGGNVIHFATSSAAQTSQMPYLDVTYDSP